MREVYHHSAQLSVIDANFRSQKTLDCFKGLFRVPENVNKSLRGRRYFNEAVCDHVGTLVSLDAMRSHLIAFPNARQKLPTTTPYTYAQTFFITRSYKQCFATNSWGWTAYTTHPPPFFRVNRAFSNVEKFQQVFRCGNSSKMVAKPRCKLFDDERPV